jgi:hypothetical protein
MLKWPIMAQLQPDGFGGGNCFTRAAGQPRSQNIFLQGEFQ